MSSARPKREVEIKLRVVEPVAARRLLKAAGFRVRRGRVFEDNRVLDTPDLALRCAGGLLRLREAGKKSTLTYKGAGSGGRHKYREEWEIEISDPAIAAAILERLGFQPVFRYQKYRTEYSKPGAGGIVMLDETPIGCFLEIEGEPEWIDRTARRLGFEETDYITASYGDLHRQFSQTPGAASRDMIFAG